MASIRDLKAKLQRARTQLENELPLIAEQVAALGKTLSEREINDKGFGATYSKNELPLFYLEGRELNQQGTAAIKKAKKAKKGLSWMDFRAAQGRPTDHVDLNYSGEMWRGMVVVRVERRGDKFVGLLGHNNVAGQQKMNWNFIRFKDFIALGLTIKNRDALGAFGTKKVTDVLKKIAL